MTNKEVIEIIEDLIADVRRITAEEEKALLMAISALSEEEKLKTQLANCHKEILRLLDLNMLTEDENDVVEKNDEVIDHLDVQKCHINTEPSDLISRAEVLKYPIRLDHYDEVNGSRQFVYGVESVIEYVEALPSYDRPTIVRCKDCEHRYWDKTSEFWTCYHTMELAIEDNDFCSLAKMKGGAE